MAENGHDKKSTAEEDRHRKAFGWAARDSSGILSPFSFSRRNNGDDDITLKILFCGICHSDLHGIKNEYGISRYPLVPGHEIVGIVTEVGNNVSKFKIGDNVGVGSIVGSCRSCDSCKQDYENYCPNMTLTYNALDNENNTTYGGYSNMLVINEHFAVKFPDNLPLDKGAPLLCAGIAAYSPMKIFGLNEPGKHLAIVGLGGLGHVAVKFAKAFGMKVTVISTSPNKEKEAIEKLGADSFLVSSNPQQMQAAMGTMDGIIDTVSAVHAITPLIFLLKPHGKMVILGLPSKPFEFPSYSLILGGKILAGSGMGGLKDTQEMIDFAGKHNITADIELIRMEHVNEAMERLAKGDVRYRFVIDVANSLASA